MHARLRRALLTTLPLPVLSHQGTATATSAAAAAVAPHAPVPVRHLAAHAPRASSQPPPRRNAKMESAAATSTSAAAAVPPAPVPHTVPLLVAGKPAGTVTITLTPLEARLFATLRAAGDATCPGTAIRVAGGWVRDKLLGRDSHDIDVALDNVTGRQFAEGVNAYLRSVGERTTSIGVIAANPDQSKHLETATTRVLDVWVDFVHLRTETYDGDSRIPAVEFGTPLQVGAQQGDGRERERGGRNRCTCSDAAHQSQLPTPPHTNPALQDAERRDFTINSLFYNVTAGCVEDWTGRGADDLRAGLLRTPLPPVTTFLDDPLRVLRALRFASRFGFAMVPELLAAARDEAVRSALAAKVSRERVGNETESMLGGGRPVAALRTLHAVGLTGVVFAVPPGHAGLLGTLSDPSGACAGAVESYGDAAGSSASSAAAGQNTSAAGVKRSLSAARETNDDGVGVAAAADAQHHHHHHSSHHAAHAQPHQHYSHPHPAGHDRHAAAAAGSAGASSGGVGASSTLPPPAHLPPCWPHASMRVVEAVHYLLAAVGPPAALCDPAVVAGVALPPAPAFGFCAPRPPGVAVEALEDVAAARSGLSPEARRALLTAAALHPFAGVRMVRPPPPGRNAASGGQASSSSSAAAQQQPHQPPPQPKSEPLPFAVMSDSLKRKHADGDEVVALLEGAAGFAAQAADPQPLPLGLLLRNVVKGSWRSALLLSAAVAITPHLFGGGASRGAVSGVAAAADGGVPPAVGDAIRSVLASHAAMAAVIAARRLDGCWGVKPPLDGKAVMAALGLPGGRAVGAYVDELVKWQLLNPGGDADGALAFLRQLQAAGGPPGAAAANAAGGGSGAGGGAAAVPASDAKQPAR